MEFLFGIAFAVLVITCGAWLRHNHFVIYKFVSSALAVAFSALTAWAIVSVSDLKNEIKELKKQIEELKK